MNKNCGNNVNEWLVTFYRCKTLRFQRESKDGFIHNLIPILRQNRHISGNETNVW